MKISQVIVVEGKNDIMAVKEAVDAFVISTSGSGISKQLINMLKTLHEQRGIIILTDPDGPGERIRSIITEHIPTAHHAFINKREAEYKGDIGIENSSVETIRKALSNFVSYNEEQVDLEYEHIVENRLVGNTDSKQLREKLCDTLNITYSNGKTLYKRLVLLNIDQYQLKKIMEELNG